MNWNKFYQRSYKNLLNFLIIIIILSQISFAENSNFKRTIFFLIDGSRADGFYSSTAKFQNIFNKSQIFLGVESTFPTITPSAHASIYTGSYPNNSGITGYRYFDRNTHNFRDLDGISDKISMLLGDDLNTPTIFEESPLPFKYSIIEFLEKGSTYHEYALPIALLYQTKSNNNHKRADYYAIKRSYKYLDSSNFSMLQIWLPGVDESSHIFGPSSVEVNKIYDNLGVKLNDFYSHLEKSPIYNETLIVFVSDHGQTGVVADSQHAKSRVELENILTAHGYSVSEDYANSDVVVALNGGMAQLYIRPSTGSWSSYPNLIDLLPALDAFYGQYYVDEVLVRIGGPTNSYMRYLGNGEVDNLDYFENNPDYPDGKARIEGLNSDRSGDIILLANYDDGFYFNDKPMAGIHGNLNPEDSYVPLVFSHPRLKGCSATGARNIDIAPTVADLMGFEMPNADGSSLASEILDCMSHDVGTTVQIDFEITNDGGSNSSGFDVKVYNGEPANGDIVFSDYVDGLGVNETRQFSFDWLGDQIGVYQFHLVVDGDDNILETDETDNLMIEEVVITEDRDHDSQTSSASVWTRASNYVNIVIDNILDPLSGTQNSIGVFVDFQTNDSFIDATIKIPYDEASLTVREDSLEMMWEDNGSWVKVPISWVNTEENYVAADVEHFSVYTAIGSHKPDLNVSLAGRDVGMVGEPYNLSIQVANTGDLTAEPSLVEVFSVVNYSFGYLGNFTTGQIMAGGSESFTLPYTGNVSGFVDFLVIVDSEGVLEEFDESDNMDSINTTFMDVDCMPGETLLCPFQDGVCTGSVKTCIDYNWSTCDYGQDYESQESLCDGLDNDCDGLIDEDLTRQCGVSDIGECMFGVETCTLGSWTNCDAILPSSEVCNGLDDDCDGEIDLLFGICSQDFYCVDASCIPPCEGKYKKQECYEPPATTTTSTTTTTLDTTTTTLATTTTTSTTTTTLPGATCDDMCSLNSYSTGTCRKNGGECSKNNEIYLPEADKYCDGGPNADTCCCTPSDSTTTTTSTTSTTLDTTTTSTSSTTSTTLVSSTCSDECVSNGYIDGYCLKNSGDCSKNGYTYLSSGDVYCVGGPTGDTCCCGSGV